MVGKIITVYGTTKYKVIKKEEDSYTLERCNSDIGYYANIFGLKTISFRVDKTATDEMVNMGLITIDN